MGQYWTEHRDPTNNPKEKRYWENNFPPESIEGRFHYRDPQMVNESMKNSGKMVILDDSVNATKIKEWCKEMKLCIINYFYSEEGYCLTFRNPEDATLCKLTWGGDTDDD